MFEEEADFAETKMLVNCHGDYSKKQGYKKGWQDGAEFGYNKAIVEADKNLKAVVADFNKANEWHYPSKGEYPKETGLLMSKTLLLITKMKGSDCSFLALGKYNFSTQEFSYQCIVGLTEVYAWKEIVLPEEIKEDD